MSKILFFSGLFAILLYFYTGWMPLAVYAFPVVPISAFCWLES